MKRITTALLALAFASAAYGDLQTPAQAEQGKRRAGTKASTQQSPQAGFSASSSLSREAPGRKQSLDGLTDKPPNLSIAAKKAKLKSDPQFKEAVKLGMRMSKTVAKKADAKPKADMTWGKSRSQRLQDSSSQESMRRKAKWSRTQQGIDKSNAGIAKSPASPRLKGDPTRLPKGPAIGAAQDSAAKHGAVPPPPGFAATPGLLDNNLLSATQSPAGAGPAAPAGRPGGTGPVFR